MSRRAPVSLNGYSAQDAFERAKSNKQAAAGALTGFAVATGTVALVSTSPLTAPALAAAGTVGAAVGLATFVAALTCGGYWYGRRCDIAKARLDAAQELADCIRYVVASDEDSAIDLFLALINADAGAAFFENDVKETALIAEQRDRLVQLFRVRAKPRFAALSAADQDGVLDLLSGKNLAQNRSVRRLALRHRSTLAHGSAGARLLSIAVQEWEKRRPDGYRCRIERLDALLTGTINAAQTRTICSDLLTLVTDRALPIATALPIVAGLTNGVTVFKALAQSAGNLAVLQRLAATKETSVKDPEVLLRAIHAFLKKMCENAVRGLPPGFQDRVRVLDKQDIPSAIDSGRLSEARTLLRRRQGLLLSGALEVVRLETGTLPYRVLMQEVDRLLEIYPNIDAQPIRCMVQKIIFNSAAERPQNRAQYYLHGPPGVGKSYFVRELASLLQLPLFSVSLSQPEQLALLETAPFGMRRDLRDEKVTDEALVGLFAFALLQSGVKNPIIFIDEAGALLGEQSPMETYQFRGPIETLKVTLDHELKTLKLAGLGDDLNLDFSHATIIFAGNEPMAESALRERVTPVRFPNMDVARKNVILERERDMALANLPEAEQAPIRANFASFVPLVLHLENEAQVAGARKVQGVVHLIVNCLRDEYLRGIDHSSEQVESLIRAHYNRSA